MNKKKFLFCIYLVLVIQTFGLFADFPGKGLLVWGLSVTLLLIAAYFTGEWKSPPE